ncbi:MAG: rRNA processing protein RimM [Frankiaceae bacterium]|nr:rRNA processing protein RimM [Frankiaceae bacterium]
MELVVGRIARAHGLKGEVALEIRTDAPEVRFAPGATVRTQVGNRTLTVLGSRPHSGRLLVTFEEIDDRTTADVLRGMVLVVDEKDSPPLDDPDEFYDHQLVGLRVEHIDGTLIGTLAEVLHLPGGETLAVTKPGGAELLIPFVSAIVPTVDVRGGRVVVDPPEGLLELGDPERPAATSAATSPEASPETTAAP